MLNVKFHNLLEKIRNSYAFPVGCIATDANGEVIACEVNDKGNGKTTYTTHAEYKVIEKLRSEGYKGEIILYITLPPCRDCLNELKKLANVKIISINYLFDTWGKSNKAYLKESGFVVKHIEEKSHEKEEMKKILVKRLKTRGHRNSLRRLKEKNGGKIFYKE